MDAALRWARLYIRFNQQLWRHVRAAAVPLLVLFGLGTVVAWIIGTQTGNELLLWSPAAYAWILAGSWFLTKAAEVPAGHFGPPGRSR